MLNWLCLGSLRARNELSLLGSIRYSEGRSFRCAALVVQQRAQRIHRSPYPDNGYAKNIRLRHRNESNRRDRAPELPRLPSEPLARQGTASRISADLLHI